MDLELANDIVLTKLISHRFILRKIVNLKNKDVYTKYGECRFCKVMCIKRTLDAHNQFCIYFIAHHLPKNNKDLNQFSYRTKKVNIRKVMGELKWFEKAILYLIDLLNRFNPPRTKLALCKYLQLNGFLIYERKT